MTPRTQARPRHRNRAEKREANRERILGAARQVFGAKGFHAATIEQIAAQAGLSNGAIYYNFASKGDLFFALLEERQEERIGHLRDSLGGASGNGEDGLGAEARDAGRSLKENREWRLLLFEFVAHAARTPALAKKLREHKRHFRAALAELLEERRGDHDGSMPADQLTLAALALTNGLAFEEVCDPGSVPETLLGDLLALLVADPMRGAE